MARRVDRFPVNHQRRRRVHRFSSLTLLGCFAYLFGSASLMNDLYHEPSAIVQIGLSLGSLFFLWSCWTAPQGKAPGKYNDLFDWVILFTAHCLTVSMIINYLQKNV